MPGARAMGRAQPHRQALRPTRRLAAVLLERRAHAVAAVRALSERAGAAADLRGAAALLRWCLTYLGSSEATDRGGGTTHYFFYSTLAPDALIAGAQRSVSSLMNAAKSRGDIGVAF